MNLRTSRLQITLTKRCCGMANMQRTRDHEAAPLQQTTAARHSKRRALVSLAGTNVEYRRKAYPERAREHGFTADITALTAAFKGGGYGRCRARQSVSYGKGGASTQVWCERRRDWTVEKWRKVILSDECSIAAGGKSGTVFTTRVPGEEYLEDCLVPKFSHFSAVVVCGAIGGHKSPLVYGTRRIGAASM